MSVALRSSFQRRLLIALAAAVSMMPLLSRLEERLRWPLADAVAAMAAATGLVVARLADATLGFRAPSGEFAFQIVGECVGLVMATALTVAVLASPIALLKRLAGLLVVLAFTGICNVVRLVVLAHVGVRAPGRFAMVHDFGWPVIQALVLVAAWHWWLRWSHSVRAEQGIRTRGASRALGVFGVLFALGWFTPAAAWYAALVKAGVTFFSKLAYGGHVRIVAADPEGTVRAATALSGRYLFAAAVVSAVAATAGLGARGRRRMLRAAAAGLAIQVAAAFIILSIGVLSMGPSGGLTDTPPGWTRAIGVLEVTALGAVWLRYGMPRRPLRLFERQLRQRRRAATTTEPERELARTRP